MPTDIHASNGIRSQVLSVRAGEDSARRRLRVPVIGTVSKQNSAYIEVRVRNSEDCRIFFIASGVGLSPLYCGHYWPIVPAPDDR
jgi:hypothetical protein